MVTAESTPAESIKALLSSGNVAVPSDITTNPLALVPTPGVAISPVDVPTPTTNLGFKLFLLLDRLLAILSVTSSLPIPTVVQNGPPDSKP